MYKLTKIVRSEKDVVSMYSKEEMMLKVSQYFIMIEEEAIEKQRMTRPTISGLALFLGFPNKKYMKKMIDTEYGDIIEYGLAMIEQRHEEQLFNPHIAGSKFWLSTQAGWREEKVEVDQSVTIVVANPNVEEAEIIQDIDEIECTQRLKDAGLILEGRIVKEDISVDEL